MATCLVSELEFMTPDWIIVGTTVTYLESELEPWSPGIKIGAMAICLESELVRWPQVAMATCSESDLVLWPRVVVPFFRVRLDAVVSVRTRN